MQPTHTSEYGDMTSYFFSELSLCKGRGQECAGSLCVCVCLSVITKLWEPTQTGESVQQTNVRASASACVT